MNSKQVTIYPNPATTNLSLSLTEGKGIAGVYMYDVLGNEVNPPLNPLQGGELINVNVSNLQNGVYFICVKTTEGSETKKIIKK